MKLHTTIATLLISLLLIFSGCSKGADTILKDKELSAMSGERVDLVASNASSYSWSQVSGRSVILINANTDTLSFIAPDVNITESLVFEVEAFFTSASKNAVTKKERATVTIHPLEVLSDDNITVPTNDNNTTVPTTSNPLRRIALTISKNSLNVDENTTLNAIATYEDNSTKDVTDEVEWILSDTNAVQITNKTLHTKKDINIFIQAKLNNKTSNTLTLEIYREINGHRLPPEPDPIVNNSTLLGIDVNNNGVRDDVERWIYTYYEKPIEHAVIMQSARAYQIVIQEPEKALENLQYILDASDCESYWSMSEEDAKSQGEAFWLEEYKNYSKEMKPVQFNTADRFLTYKKFNQTLSGGVYSSSSLNEWKNRCDFNSSTLIKNP